MTPLSVQDIARIYNATANRIYKLAHRHGWRRITHDGRTYYSSEDVDRSMGSGTAT